MGPLPSADRAPIDTQALGDDMNGELALEQFDRAKSSSLEFSRAPLWAHATPPTAEPNRLGHYLGSNHYMTVERHLRFQVAEGLAQFSKRWLIVDGESRGPKAPAYASEDLIEALLKRFRNVRGLQLHSEAHNFLLCEK